MVGVWTGASHGLDWKLELERIVLLPGRLVGGRVSITASDAVEARALIIALRGEEHWQHRVTTTDAQGHSSTRVVTERDDLVNEPVQVASSVQMAQGETRTWSFEVPVPPLGPATLEAEVAGLTWTVQARLDVPGGFDSSIECPVRVAQPVALLRSGAVPLAEFALYGSADADGGDATASISLDPVPLCVGEQFTGSVTLRTAGTHRLQEVRAEIRVQVEATVADGLEETITAWTGTMPITELSGDHTMSFAGRLDDQALPTIELPHSRTAASFHVILATARAPDPHLVRDIAIATTLEL